MPTLQKRQPHYQGKLIAVETVAVAYEDGTVRTREVVRHGPVVAIVALQEQTDSVAHGLQVVMVRQFRAPVERELLEIVMGQVDAGETALEAAQREFREETGLAAETWVELGTLLSSPGFTDEAATFFLARDLRPTETSAEEHLTLCTVPFTLLLEQVQRGEIEDAKTVAGLLWAALHLQAKQAG